MTSNSLLNWSQGMDDTSCQNANHLQRSDESHAMLGSGYDCLTNVHMESTSRLKQLWGDWGWDQHTAFFSKSQQVFFLDSSRPEAQVAEQYHDTLYLHM